MIYVLFMKNKTPIAQRQPNETAGHTIQMDDRAKRIPMRWVILLPRSS